jgi:hypothetical protein
VLVTSVLSGDMAMDSQSTVTSSESTQAYLGSRQQALEPAL